MKTCFVQYSTYNKFYRAYYEFQIWRFLLENESVPQPLVFEWHIYRSKEPPTLLQESVLFVLSKVAESVLLGFSQNIMFSYPQLQRSLVDEI